MTDNNSRPASPTLVTLPIELQLNIASCLSVRTIYTLRHSNRHLHDVLLTPDPSFIWWDSDWSNYSNNMEDIVTSQFEKDFDLFRCHDDICDKLKNRSKFNNEKIVPKAQTCRDRENWAKRLAEITYIIAMSEGDKIRRSW